MYSAGGEENFLTLSLQENYIPPTHRKNDTSLTLINDCPLEGAAAAGGDKTTGF